MARPNAHSGGCLIKADMAFLPGLLQIGRADLIGRQPGAFITPADRPAFNACLAHVFSTQGKRIACVTWHRADGQLRHIRMELIAIEAEPICRVVIVDTTEYRQSGLALAQERRFLHQIIDASPSLIFVKDREGRFMLCNPAPHAYGTNVANLVGRTDADSNPHPEPVARFRTHDREIMDEVLTFADGSIHFLAHRLIEQQVTHLSWMVESKNQTLVVSLPQVPVWLDADMVRLTQVRINLLRNAAKYTPHGGHIKLMARVVEHEVEVRVHDNGMGMSAEPLGCVFDLFSQDERTLDRAQGGLGIGLALVRKVVELHEGRVEAHSARPGLGSEFTVWLPLAPRPQDRLPYPNASAITAVPVRILIVDDDPMVLDSTAVVLQLDGHEVCTAANGEEALRVAPTFRPQLVLLDIGLGGMDGYQVAERLRALPNGDTLMLVALSGYGLEEDRQRSIAAGFDRHLVKPVEPAVLASLFDALKNA